MASLRPQTAARLLRTTKALPAPRISYGIASRRFESSKAALTQTTGAAPVTVPEGNEPDYSIAPDKATSLFTPVPKRIQDGTEEVLPASIISGAPLELQARTVRIYKESKPATQSGHWRGDHWRMDWDVLGKGHRWENPLMGWQSSGDAMQGTNLHFHSKEDAVRFAEKQGYEYFVQEPTTRSFTPKAYANNFLYSARKLKHIRAK